MKKKEAVKEKIGKAAMQCFARFGLEKTTLDDIATSVGLNKASLYYYYKNKEDIFLEVAIAEGQQFIQQLQEKTLLKKGVENRIQYYLQERMQYYMLVLNRNKVTVNNLQKILPRFFELYDQVMQQEVVFIQSLLAEGMKKNEIIKTDALRLASSLVMVSDAVKHSSEQQALLKNEINVSYAKGMNEIKFLVQLIFKGLKIKNGNGK